MTRIRSEASDRYRPDRGGATVAAAVLAVLAALFVAVVVQGPLETVERLFLVTGVALVALGAGFGARLARRPRPRLMDGRFEGDDLHARDQAGPGPGVAAPGGAALGRRGRGAPVTAEPEEGP